MKKFMGEIVTGLGWTDTLIYALLLAGMWSTVSGIASLVPGLEFRRLAPFVTIALVLGWLLSSPRIRMPFLALAGLTLGLIFVFFQVSQLGGLFRRGLLAFLQFSFSVKNWPVDGPPDPQPLYELVSEFYNAIVVVSGRLTGWLAGLPASLGAFDLIIAAFIWGFLLWSVSFWAAGVMRRAHKPMLSLAPAGALLGVSLAYSHANPLHLVPFLGVTLLLSVFQSLHRLDRRWKTADVDYPEDIWVDMGGTGLGLVAVLTVLAWAAPSINPQQLAEFIRRLNPPHDAPAQTLAGSLGLESQEVEPRGLGGFSYGGLPRQHLIGTGPELSDIIVMDILVKEISTEETWPAGLKQPNLYWRSLTYDEYNGRGWETGKTELVSYPAEQPLYTIVPPGYRVIQQDVQVLQNLNGLLHLAGTPIIVNADIEVAWRDAPPLEVPEQGFNAVGGDIFGIRLKAETYQVRSLIPSPAADSLRRAGTDYPAGIRAHYTQLPGSVPDRVLALARDLTVTEPTPYDQAAAIESYLRSYPYTLDVPVPPASQDVTDYFLFDLKQGYCDYYATAMAVLARAAGLPARIVMGFASGDFDSENDLYTVTAADAHTWVEIYFPGFGWVEFEPTAGLPAIERPEGDSGVFLGDPSNALGIQESTRWNFFLMKTSVGGRFLWLLLVGGGLAAGLLGAFYVRPAIQGFRLRQMNTRAAFSRIFSDLYRQTRWLALPLTPGTTVLEYSASLRQNLADTVYLQGNPGRKRQFEMDLEALVALFVRHLFSVPVLSSAEQSAAITIWIRLHRVIRWIRFRQVLAIRHGKNQRKSS